MHRHLPALALAALVCLATSGCGEDEDCCAPVEPRASQETPSALPTTPTEPTGGVTTPPSEGMERIRVVGQVVEVGDCVVVRDDNRITWTVGGDLAGELVLHDRVDVTGAPDLRATGCGGPLVGAVSVRVLPPVE